MKLWPLLLLASSLSALSQGVRFDSSVTTTAKNVPYGAQAAVLTVPYASVTVCPYTSALAPCTTTSPIYSDSTLTQLIAQPLQTDSTARYGFWVASGLYQQCLTSLRGENLGCFALTLSSSAGPMGKTGPAGTTTAVGVNGGFAVPGQLAVGGSIALNATDCAGGACDTQNITFQTAPKTTDIYRIAAPHEFVWQGVGVNNGNFDGTNDLGLRQNCYFYVAGVGDCLSSSVNVWATGDHFADYVYVNGLSGYTSNGDEAIGGHMIQINLSRTNGAGAVSAQSGGDLTVTNNGTRLVAGTWLADTSTSQTAHVTGQVAAIAAFPNYGTLPVAEALTPLTCWATDTSGNAIELGVKPLDTYVNTTVTVQVQPMPPGSTNYVQCNPGYIRIGGNNSVETASINSYGWNPMDAATHQQTFVIHSRTSQDSFMLTQGPGYDDSITLDADVSAQGGLVTGYPALGSFTGHEVIVGSQQGGTVIPSILTSRLVATDGTSAASQVHLLHSSELISTGTNGVTPTVAVSDHAWTGANYENVTFPVQQLHGGLVVLNAMTLPNASYEDEVMEYTMDGANASSSTLMFKMSNKYSFNHYISGGGPLIAPGIFHIQGPFSSMWDIDETPQAPAVGLRGTFVSFDHLPNFEQGNQALEDFTPFNLFSFGNLQTPTGAYPGQFIAYNPSDGSITSRNWNFDYVKAVTFTATINNGPGFQASLYTPPSSSAPCTTGQFSDDTAFHYVCVNTNSWMRVALATF